VSELNTHPAPSHVRGFGALWLPSFSGIAGALALLRWNQPALGWTLLAVASASELATWLAPGAVRPVLVAVNVLTWPIAWVTNRVLLGVLYFGLITPAGIVARMLDRSRSGGDSYWTPREAPRSVDRYFRPY